MNIEHQNNRSELIKEHGGARQGMSLLEVVIAMGLSAVVLVFVGMMQSQLTRVAGFIKDELSNQQGLEEVMTTFVSEVRSAGPSSVGGYAIESGSSTQFVFFSDIDGDGLFDRVRYTLTSSTLVKGTTKPSGNPLTYATSSEKTRTLVTNVLPASSTFIYYDTDYTGSELPLTAPVTIERVRIVQLNLYADLSPSTAPQPSFFTETVTIRNLRSN
jgi:prepilin-type N-terminal cleavage/methylation domain-containing protein